MVLIQSWLILLHLFVFEAGGVSSLSALCVFMCGTTTGQTGAWVVFTQQALGKGLIPSTQHLL